MVEEHGGLLRNRFVMGSRVNKSDRTSKCVLLFEHLRPCAKALPPWSSSPLGCFGSTAVTATSMVHRLASQPSSGRLRMELSSGLAMARWVLELVCQAFDGLWIN